MEWKRQKLDNHVGTILLAFLSFNVFVSIDKHSVKIKVCWRVVDCDSGLESQLVKFFWLQLWLWLCSPAPQWCRQGGHRGHMPPSHVGVPTGPACLHFFCKILQKKMFYHICKMKWPESMEKIEMGALGCLGPSASIFVFFLQNFTNFPFLPNEVNEIPGENWNWGAWEVRGPSGWHAPSPPPHCKCMAVPLVPCYVLLAK